MIYEEFKGTSKERASVSFIHRDAHHVFQVADSRRTDMTDDNEEACGTDEDKLVVIAYSVQLRLR